MIDYIDLKYVPKKSDLVCIFKVKPAGVSLQEAARAIAGESSIGTWTEIGTIKPSIVKRLKPSVFEMSKEIIKVAYPIALFEPGNMPGILSSVAGNIFGMSVIESLRIEDISFPAEVLRHYKGPAFGIAGIRKLMKVPKRPLVGTIIKPKVGLDEQGHSKVAYNAWIGGCDFVKDDENLTSQNFNRFDKRVKETLRMRDKAEELTGERKMYFANVTAETKEMIRRARLVKGLGGEYIMVDVLTIGWSGLQTLVNEDLGLVIHGHRAGHAAITRNKNHGISMLVIAKICRILGIDQLHIGSILGKMESGKREVLEIEEEIEEPHIVKRIKDEVLSQDWPHIKPSLAVASGGLYPALLPRLIDYFGNDVVIQAGGGIHGHPDGTVSGAKAMRQAIDASIAKVPLKEYARSHKELSRALERWPLGKKYAY